jgi:N2,N2-dimethylguanosine tRNA methyltransferase
MILIKEGSAEFFVPDEHSSGGPGKITDSVFFNEQMAFNRDISVMLLRSLGRKMSAVDAMSASGSRAIRIAKECPDISVTANDRSPEAYELIKKNIEFSGLTNCEATNKNLHILLTESVFDYVDIDPFGSPMPFLHSAIRGCRRKGILAITATDTAPLAGAHRGKCERRYQSRPMRGPMCHETGLRILMATVARELAKFDRGMKPILSFYSDHYFRTYVEVTEGADAADNTLGQLIHMSYDRKTLERNCSNERNEEFCYGPFWGGPLHNKDILEKMDASGMEKEKRCNKMLGLWKEELDNIPISYDVSEISSFLKVTSPRIENLLEIMNRYGKASRSHTSPTAFRTDLDLKDMLNAFTEASMSTVVKQ